MFTPNAGGATEHSLKLNVPILRILQPFWFRAIAARSGYQINGMGRKQDTTGANCCYFMEKDE